MKKLIIILLACLPLLTIGQEEKKEDIVKEKVEQKAVGIKFSGFVKNDAFFDSRQTVSAREGHFLLYPSNVSNDIEGNDINAKTNFNMLAIQSRLTGKFSGPDAFGAKTSGVLEGAFFGHSNADVNGYRLRHAFAKLNWEKTELLFGQYWHPMFVTSCFPGVVSFSTGVPFQPFSRNPQIRLTQTDGNMKFIFAALAQRDFTSPGGSTSLRNSASPEVHMQIQYTLKSGESETVMGIGGDYKSIVPRLATDSAFKTFREVRGFSGIAFIKYKIPDVTFKLEGVLGQNQTDLLMLGGYAYRETEDNEKIRTNDFSYTTLDNMSIWSEIHTNGKKVQVGIFAGYTKNLSSLKRIQNWTSGGSYFGRGSNIDYVYRVSPRVIFMSGNFKFAGEIDYTTAAYGEIGNDLGEIVNSEEVSNVRVLFSTIYSFK